MNANGQRTEGVPYAPGGADRITDEFAREFLSRYLAAWNARDSEALLSLTTADVLWEDPTIETGTARGQIAVRAWLEGFWRAFPDITFAFLDGEDETTPDAIFHSSGGRRLAVPWRCSGTMRGPLSPPGFAPTGKRVNLVGVDLYAFRAEKLCHVRTITDLQDAARQLGILPKAGGSAERTMATLQRTLVRLGRNRG